MDFPSNLEQNEDVVAALFFCVELLQSIKISRRCLKKKNFSDPLNASNLLECRN